VFVVLSNHIFCYRRFKIGAGIINLRWQLSFSTYLFNIKF